MTSPEFVTTELPGGLLKVESYGRHWCEVIIEGVSAEDAEKFKTACTLGPTGYLRIDSPLIFADLIKFPANGVPHPTRVTYNDLRIVNESRLFACVAIDGCVRFRVASSEFTEYEAALDEYNRLDRHYAIVGIGEDGAEKVLAVAMA